MNLLKNLVLTNVNEGDDLSLLPANVLAEIKKNIRSGAMDTSQRWANALELCHKAFEVSGTHRPTPDLKGAWKQYEELLTFAVQQLAKNRGMDGDWRMSSSVFHEAYTQAMIPARVRKFRVHYNSNEHGHSSTVEADNIDDVIKKLTKDCPYDFHVSKHDNEVRIDFSRWGIKRGAHISITRV